MIRDHFRIKPGEEDRIYELLGPLVAVIIGVLIWEKVKESVEKLRCS